VDGARFAFRGDVTRGDSRLAVYADSLLLLGTSALLKYLLALLAFCFHCWQVGCWLRATWEEERNNRAYKHTVLTDCVL